MLLPIPARRGSEGLFPERQVCTTLPLPILARTSKILERTSALQQERIGEGGEDIERRAPGKAQRLAMQVFGWVRPPETGVTTREREIASLPGLSKDAQPVLMGELGQIALSIAAYRQCDAVFCSRRKYGFCSKRCGLVFKNARKAAR